MEKIIKEIPESYKQITYVKTRVVHEQVLEFAPLCDKRHTDTSSRNYRNVKSAHPSLSTNLKVQYEK